MKGLFFGWLITIENSRLSISARIDHGRGAYDDVMLRTYLGIN